MPDKIYIYGDSLLKATVPDVDFHYHFHINEVMQRYQTKLVEVVNRSKMGATIRKGLSLVRHDLDRGLEARYALVSYGGNDSDYDWAAIDADPGVLDYYAENAQGIVIAGAGAGSSSGLWGEKIEELVGQGIPVVDSSRINNGLVSGEDGGMIEGYNLPPQKAVVLLRLALTITTDLDEIQEMFKTY